MPIRLLLVLMLSLAGCNAPSPAVDANTGSSASAETARLAARLDNADVDWDGTYSGLMPRVRGEAAERLIEFGPAADSALVRALGDPHRFAAAHVVLTTIHVTELELSASEWNGLRVDLPADGRTRLFPEQRAELQRRWRERLRGS